MKREIRQKAAAAVGVALAVPAGFGAIALLGPTAGIATAIAVGMGGVFGVLKLMPSTETMMLPSPRSRSEFVAVRNQIIAVTNEIKTQEVAAVIRHVSALLDRLEADLANPAIVASVVLDAESLLGIARAWKETEARSDSHEQLDRLARYTVSTIGEIAANARARAKQTSTGAVNALEIELAVTQRINESQSKELDYGHR